VAAAGGNAAWTASRREPPAAQGWVSPHLTEELPGLGIAWVEVDARPRRSPEAVLRHLRDLSDRFYGSHAIHLRERPIPWAYRVFFRQIGLDPDRTRTPIERLALDRLHDGAFKTRGMPTDALTIATVETGVALRAFDAERITGKLCIRDSGPGESLPGRSSDLPHGTLVLADERGPLELLFGEDPGPDRVGRDTRRVAIVAVQVKGVPQASVGEALWIASAALVAA
jgi:DNA/RNA-binding domain of Phe-tRNA-synthetase-like protein